MTRDASARPDPPATASLERTLELLTDRRRRYAMYALRNGDAGTRDLDEITDSVVAREREHGTDQVDEAAVRVALHHAHLPKLDDAGVVDYDHGAGTVTSVEADPLANVLDAVRAVDPAFDG